MRIFKNTWFDKFARKAGISDNELKDMVADLEKGLWNADYGGNVYKKRIARQGKGKRGGYRAIIIFRSENITYFSYAFPKSKKDNISEKEERELKNIAKDILGYTNEEIEMHISAGTFIEIV